VIPELGHFALVVALALALAQASLSFAGAATGRAALLATSRPIAVGHFVFVAGAFAALAASFVANDFSVVNVATNSNSKLPTAYRFAATWGSHEGSMLLWTLMLAGWTFAVAVFSRHLAASPYGLPSERSEAASHTASNQGWCSSIWINRWPTMPVAPRTPTGILFDINEGVSTILQHGDAIAGVWFRSEKSTHSGDQTAFSPHTCASGATQSVGSPSLE